MVTATKNSIDNFLNNTSTNSSSKATSETYKADSKQGTSKSEASKSEDFKEVLNSKANSKDVNNEKVDEVNKNESSTETQDVDKVTELEEKLKELEEESKSGSKDEVTEILNELLVLLAKLGIKEEDLKSNGQTSPDILKTMINKINGDGSSKNNLNNIMEKLIELLKTDSVKDGLDTNSLKLMEKLLSNLSANIADDNTNATKDIKSGLKNLMSEISNIIDNKQSQNGKVLTLEDILNKNYSQDNKENSTENQSNKNATSESTTKEVSKEDKFLNSLIDDDKDSSLNKINLFASRTQTVQNQGVDTVRGLTINKATFADDLIKDVKFMSNNALKELTVKVNPGTLGEITIKLIQEDGVMKANLKANSKETTALLSQNLAEIKKQIGEQNIKIADVNIELYQEDTTFFREQGFGRQPSEEQGRSNNIKNNNNNNGAIIEEDLIENIASNNGNLEFFA